MTDKNPTKADLQETLEEAQKRNDELTEERDALLNAQADMDSRLARMEALMDEQKASGEYRGPEPKVYHDPFECNNPHKILAHPEGKRLSWKNPKIRNDGGWKGWDPVTWDSEIGKDLDTYIASPPSKMEGISTQDNYVRRGTDSVLAMIDEEIWFARQENRKSKAMRKQLAANARANQRTGEGVETFGDGVTQESRGYGRGKVAAPVGGVRTPMLPTEE